jgi:hypothetical protein
MANVAEFAAAYAGRDPGGMPDLDEALMEAFHKDAKAYFGTVVSGLLPTGWGDGAG